MLLVLSFLVFSFFPSNILASPDDASEFKYNAAEISQYVDTRIAELKKLGQFQINLALLRLDFVKVLQEKKGMSKKEAEEVFDSAPDKIEKIKEKQIVAHIKSRLLTDLKVISTKDKPTKLSASTYPEVVKFFNGKIIPDVIIVTADLSRLTEEEKVDFLGGNSELEFRGTFATPIVALNTLDQAVFDVVSKVLREGYEKFLGAKYAIYLSPNLSKLPEQMRNTTIVGNISFLSDFIDHPEHQDLETRLQEIKNLRAQNEKDKPIALAALEEQTHSLAFEEFLQRYVKFSWDSIRDDLEKKGEVLDAANQKRYERIMRESATQDFLSSAKNMYPSMAYYQSWSTKRALYYEVQFLKTVHNFSLEKISGLLLYRGEDSDNIKTLRDGSTIDISLPLPQFFIDYVKKLYDATEVPK